MVEPLDQLIHRDVGAVEYPRHLAAIEHVETVDDRIDVEDVMVDEDRRLAGGLDRADEVERLLGLAERQTHRRLVEDDELGFEMKRAGDRHTLFLAARHRRHDIVGVHRRRGEAHVLAHQPRAFVAHRGDVEQAKTIAQFTAHEHVAPDRLFLAQRAFLIDGLDAETARSRHRPVVNSLAVEVDLAAGIGL